MAYPLLPGFAVKEKFLLHYRRAELQIQVTFKHSFITVCLKYEQERKKLNRPIILGRINQQHNTFSTKRTVQIPKPKKKNI